MFPGTRVPNGRRKGSWSFVGVVLLHRCTGAPPVLWLEGGRRPSGYAGPQGQWWSRDGSTGKFTSSLTKGPVGSSGVVSKKSPKDPCFPTLSEHHPHRRRIPLPQRKSGPTSPWFFLLPPHSTRSWWRCGRCGDGGRAGGVGEVRGVPLRKWWERGPRSKGCPDQRPSFLSKPRGTTRGPFLKCEQGPFRTTTTTLVTFDRDLSTGPLRRPALLGSQCMKDTQSPLWNFRKNLTVNKSVKIFF